MEPGRANFRVYQGSVFDQIFRWETATKTYANIININRSAPCVIQVAVGSEVPPASWRVRINNVLGMKEINNLGDDTYYISTNSFGNTVIINEIDSTNYTAYTPVTSTAPFNGVLSWNYPRDLSVYTGARLQIRKTTTSSTVELELTSTAGEIILDNTEKTIRVKMSSDQTANLNFLNAVYSLELTDVDDNNLIFVIGNLSLTNEVVR